MQRLPIFNSRFRVGQPIEVVDNSRQISPDFAPRIGTEQPVQEFGSLQQDLPELNSRVRLEQPVQDFGKSEEKLGILMIKQEGAANKSQKGIVWNTDSYPKLATRRLLCFLLQEVTFCIRDRTSGAFGFSPAA